MLTQTNCPLDYSLCDQTVTVYRKLGQEIHRQVVENCYFQRQAERVTDALGSRGNYPFLLVIPGPIQQVFPGDRVVAGVGPEIGAEELAGFIPAKAAGVYEVAYVTPYYWDSAICHVEAGRKQGGYA